MSSSFWRNPFRRIRNDISNGLQDQFGFSKKAGDAFGAGVIGVDNYAIGKTLRQQSKDSYKLGWDSAGDRFEQIAGDEADRNLEHPERAFGRAVLTAGAVLGGMYGAGAIGGGGGGAAGGGAGGSAGGYGGLSGMDLAADAAVGSGNYIGGAGGGGGAGWMNMARQGMGMMGNMGGMGGGGQSQAQNAQLERQRRQAELLRQQREFDMQQRLSNGY